MSDIAIRVENLSKRYRIGARRRSYKTLRESIVDKCAAPFRLFAKPQAAIRDPQSEILWALKDVSFDVRHGDVVGIIGRNGAGKSTLLKVLSRITDPTSGRITLNGRVGSLLEVGTGFHSELTGRENIYLSGAILGMRHEEIDRKFDEIVAFSEIERFLDTAVKHYSSGMHMRLAFAVAAHLDPEILVIDEVLAVGDAAFQKRCLGKMQEVSSEGRTVLFVSHNMAAVENLCSSGLLLNAGSLAMRGPMDKVIAQYLSGLNSQSQHQELRSRTDRRGEGSVHFVGFHFEEDGRLSIAARTGADITLVFGYEARTDNPLRRATVSFAIQNIYGTNLILHRTNFTNQDFDLLPPTGEFCCTISRFPLVAGRYRIVAALELAGQTVDVVEDLAYLDVEAGDFFGTGQQGWPHHSPFLIDGKWSLRQHGKDGAALDARGAPNLPVVPSEE